MTVISQIVPGKVVNHGINDKSIPDYVQESPTYPLHMPVISVVTPKGPLASEAGTQWVPVNNFADIFGNIMDPKTPYYNPTSLAIRQAAAGGQATIGVRRMSANDRKARVALSAFVSKKEVLDYERDALGNFKRDENGDKIPTGDSFEGLFIVIKPDETAGDLEVGGLKRRTIPAVPGIGGLPDVDEVEVYPLFEAIAGVGDEYNRSVLQLGTNTDPLSLRGVSDFIKATGVFPFQIRTFSEQDSGLRRYAKTITGQELSDLTLFETSYLNQTFSIKHGFGNYNNTNLNRKSVPIPGPFNSTYVYQDSITALCQLMYYVESQASDTLLEDFDLPYQQMNPFGLFDHLGAPYYAIENDGVQVWDLIGGVQAEHGISPFLNNDGELPDYVEREPLDDPFGIMAGAKRPITMGEGWVVNNQLMIQDLLAYIDSAEPKNYTKNIQSIMWDVGYIQEVKDIMISFLGIRKDIIVIPCGSVWEPGKPNSVEEIYSRATSIANQLRMYPESEKWGTATCRAATNSILAKLTDEATGDYFSGNLDLIKEFAEAGGNSQGIYIATRSPDSGDNRVLNSMYNPLVEFEDDFIASGNFNNGIITLRSRDQERVFRPALPTVYSNADSVLKDLVTVFLCVSLEKIGQDEWNALCGDTTISSSSYQALFKDNVERKARDRLGGVVKGITVEPYFVENVPGGKATMKSIIHAYFNKGKYMMELDLFAYNSDDLAN